MAEISIQLNHLISCTLDPLQGLHQKETNDVIACSPAGECVGVDVLLSPSAQLQLLTMEQRLIAASTAAIVQHTTN
jgi:hypothetical protein